MLRPLKVLVATTQPLNEISEIVIPQNCGSGVWPYLGTVVRRNELGLILQNCNLPVYSYTILASRIMTSLTNLINSGARVGRT